MSYVGKSMGNLCVCVVCHEAVKSCGVHAELFLPEPGVMAMCVRLTRVAEIISQRIWPDTVLLCSDV